MIHEFYRYDDTFCINCFDGRWSWRRVESCGVDCVRTGIKWTDLFGKWPDIEFFFETSDLVERMVPLTRRFLLLQLETGEFPERFQIADLDWPSGEARTGEIMSSPEFKNGFFNEFTDDYEVLADRGSSSDIGDLSFLLCTKKLEQMDFLHCKIECEQRHIQQLGNSFQLPYNKFRCMNFHNGIIKGLSTSLDTITCFDIGSRRILSTIQVHGLPSSEQILDVSAWSDDRLYLRVVESEHEQIHSSIYVIQLETSDVVKLSHVFDGKIEQLTIEPNNNLYVRMEKRLHYLPAFSPRTVDIKYDMTMSGYLMRYQFLRLPISHPESLVFLSAAAIPRPLPAIARRIIEQKDDVPAEFYK